MLRQILGLSIALAKAGFKIRNEGSYLGILWYLLNPLLMFTILIAVFSARLGQDIPSYPLYLLLGIIMFNFFQQATTESTMAINEHKCIIKSIKFPYESLIGSIVMKSLFSHLFEALLFIIFILLFGATLTGIVFYPLILFLFCLFVTGISLTLSALTVYFTDMENIWFFASRLLWLATPIFYVVESKTRLFNLVLFNPMYYFITIARDLIIYSKIPELWLMAGALGYSLLSLVMGIFIFNRLKENFAELI